MVSITLHPDAYARFERKLGEAFESSSYSETAKAWNEERSRVVQEALEAHLVPVGVKWVREWLRDEVEDWLSKRCAVELRNVSFRAPRTRYLELMVHIACRRYAVRNPNYSTWRHAVRSRYLLG
jgi:hypothetical protein